MILVDNTETSLNGDFSPNRLQAQLDAAEALWHSFHQNPESLVGLGNLGHPCDVAISPTKDFQRFRFAVDKVARSGTFVDLPRAIGVALLALRRRPKEARAAHLVVMLAGPHNLTMEGAESLGSAALSGGVLLDLVLFGTDKIDQRPLERLVEKLGQPSRLHRIPRAMELAGSVREALVGAGAYSDERDEAMQRAIAASRAEAGLVDDDLARAIRESAEGADGEGDPDVQRAIALSMLEPDELVGEAAAEDEPAADDPARAEEEEAMSPDLLLAMAMTREEPPDHEPNAVEPPERSDDEADESVQQALAMSIAPPPDDGDDELDLNDPEVQRALAMSNEEPPDGDENDPNDPELRPAIRASLARDSSDDEHQGAGGPPEDNHLPAGPPDQGTLRRTRRTRTPVCRR
jgi:26S proteasome regulatory subunit N10